MLTTTVEGIRITAPSLLEKLLLPIGLDIQRTLPEGAIGFVGALHLENLLIKTHVRSTLHY